MTVWDKHLGRPLPDHQPNPWVIVSGSRVADMPRRQATPAGSCGGIPSICSFSASPAVDLLATHGHRLLGDYRFDPRTAVAAPRGPERGQGAAIGHTNRPIGERSWLAPRWSRRG